MIWNEKMQEKFVFFCSFILLQSFGLWAAGVFPEEGVKTKVRERTTVQRDQALISISSKE